MLGPHATTKNIDISKSEFHYLLMNKLLNYSDSYHSDFDYSERQTRRSVRRFGVSIATTDSNQCSQLHILFRRMATPREQEAADYLRKHKIIELMDNLTSMLFFYRPGQTYFSSFVNIFFPSCVVAEVKGKLACCANCTDCLTNVRKEGHHNNLITSILFGNVSYLNPPPQISCFVFFLILQCCFS